MTHNKLTAEEFKNEGFLQEVNRQFFHPLGLALALDVDKSSPTGVLQIEVWDERGDPEGWFFHPSELDDSDVAQKIKNVEDLRKSKEAERIRVAGSVVQAPGGALL